MLDSAGWHTAKKLRAPKGYIHLEFLPSHSTELQPAEEGVANRHFERIEDLEKVLVERCMALGDHPRSNSTVTGALVDVGPTLWRSKTSPKRTRSSR